MHKFLLAAIAFLALGYYSEVPAQGRTEASVAGLLVGEWQVTNMVVNPGEPFLGSKEEKEIMDEIWKETVNLFMGSTIFNFLPNKKYSIRVKQKDDKYKSIKGVWRLEKNGDVLIITEKKKEEDRIKVLLIDEENLELLFDYDDGFMLILERRN